MITQGKWTVTKIPEKHRGYSWLRHCVSAKDFNIAHVGDEDNARLIAAAPDLLEACKGLHGALSRMIDKHNPDSIEAEWLADSHEAIAKTEGGRN